MPKTDLDFHLGDLVVAETSFREPKEVHGWITSLWQVNESSEIEILVTWKDSPARNGPPFYRLTGQDLVWDDAENCWRMHRTVGTAQA